MMTHLIVAGLVVMGILGLLALLLNRAGCSCHECGGRMNSYGELSEERQRRIRRYFREEENRRPDLSQVFVCPRCHFVYDDFSGEKLSLDGDERTFCKVCGSSQVHHMYQASVLRGADKFRQAYPELVEKYRCLRCGGDPRDRGHRWRPGNPTADCILCETEPKLLACTDCITLCRWYSPDDTELKFMKPITDESLAEEPRLQAGL